MHLWLATRPVEGDWARNVSAAMARLCSTSPHPPAGEPGLIQRLSGWGSQRKIGKYARPHGS